MPRPLSLTPSVSSITVLATPFKPYLKFPLSAYFEIDNSLIFQQNENNRFFNQFCGIVDVGMSCNAAEKSKLVKDNLIEKEVQVKDFSQVEAYGAVKVTIYQGFSKPRVVLKGNENGLRRTSLKVNSGKLYIVREENIVKINDRVELNIYCKRVTDLTAFSGSSISATSVNSDKVT